MRPSVVAGLLVLLALNAHAETFTVTRTDDPSPDGCLPGSCSLREAMEAAAANDPFGAIDVVIVPAGTILLTRGELNVVAQRLRLRLRVQGTGSNLTQRHPEANTIATNAAGRVAVLLETRFQFHREGYPWVAHRVRSGSIRRRAKDSEARI